MKRLLLFTLLIFCIAQAGAESLLRPDHPDKYVVKEGDTLWGIASIFLNDPWLWPDIWDVNPQVENPHLIYPGDIIYLRYRDGQPSIVVVRPGEALPPDEPIPTPDDEGGFIALETPTRLPSRPPPVTEPPVSSSGVVRSVPGGMDKLVPRIRVTPLKNPIPAIPLDAISGLLISVRPVEDGEIDDAPYVVAGYDTNLIFGTGGIFYARGDEDEWQMANEVYGVYKTHEVYRDPETNKVLGVEAKLGGLARFKRYVDDIATFDLISVTEGINIGDVLLPTEERSLDSTFFPKAPDVEIRGAIMKVIGGLSSVGTYDTIAINRGEEDGLRIGDILEVYRKGREVDDPNRFFDVRLPAERTGLVMVYLTYDYMSYGIVLQARDYMAVGDPLMSP
ncbi:MAG: LysM peptidoglycan-binding domain-containing protein [Gammaproteobacteria bacterium]|nr:LysM peptidoglycan-binding domain-containing protein [Gammaproteobacteria bacterium]